MIKLGIIGIGRIGRYHLDNLSKMTDMYQVVAIADAHLHDLRDIAHQYNVPMFSTNYRDLLANHDVEAVLVATTTDTHADICISAAYAGKHILCEKPIDVSLIMIKKVIEAVDKAGVKFQVGFNRRFDHNFARIKERIDDGDVGKVNMVRIASRDPKPPTLDYIRGSGGIFLDMMIHDFDMARYLTGGEVIEIYATGSTLIDEGIEQAGDVDTAAAILKFDNGALCLIDNSRQAVYGYDQRVEVFGSKGQCEAANEIPTTVSYFDREGIHRDTIPYFFLDRYENAFRSEYRAFHDAIVNNTDVVVGAHDGYKSVEIALAATESIVEKRPVNLEVDREWE